MVNKLREYLGAMCAGRDLLPDVLKGFGVLLVVYGHCIQESYQGQGDAFFDDKLYQFIYSFHMPLFIVISGYYAWNSVHRAVTAQERRLLIGRKCAYLITPCVAWKLVGPVRLLLAGGYAHRTAGAFLLDFLDGLLTDMWFLWAILYAFLLVCAMHYLFRDSVWIYALIFLAMFFTPDGMALMACKYLLPYYLIGFYANQYGSRNKDRLRKAAAAAGGRGRAAALVASGVLFLGLVSFFDADSFVYLTGYKLIGKDYAVQLRIDLYRFAVGLCGIVFWSLFWHAVLRLRRQWRFGVQLLSYIGRRGMGIYIVSGIAMQYVAGMLVTGGKPHYGVCVAGMAVVLACSLGIVEVLGRIRGVHMVVGL